MNKLGMVLIAIVLAAGACTTPEEPPKEGIAALDESKENEAPATTKGDAKKTQDGGAKPSGSAGSSGKKKSSGGGSQAVTGGGSSGASNQDGGGGGGTTQAQVAAPAPVPQGEHQYATQGQRTINGNTSELPKTTTLAANAPVDGVQRQGRDLRDSEGNGTLTETDLHYRSNGVFLSYVKVTSRFQGGLTDVREFKLPRPVLVAPRGGGPGFTQSFTMQGSGTTAKVTIEANRWENVTVGGKQARALLVQTDIRFSGALEGYQRSTSWFWPKHLLALKEQVQTDVRNGPIRLQSNYQAQLKQLPG